MEKETGRVRIWRSEVESPDQNWKVALAHLLLLGLCPHPAPRKLYILVKSHDGPLGGCHKGESV